MHGFSVNNIHDLVVPLTGTQLIQALAKEVDELTTVVVERAEQVSRNPGNRRAREELDTLRRQWASKVQELTQVIDDIIDPEDFMAKSGMLTGVMGGWCGLDKRVMGWARWVMGEVVGVIGWVRWG